MTTPGPESPPGARSSPDARPEHTDPPSTHTDAPSTRANARPAPADAHPTPADAQPTAADARPTPADTPPSHTDPPPPPADARPMRADARPMRADARPMRADARPMRADARRNRDRLLDAAVRAFSVDAEVTLDAIAKDAGVGIGTLYRHFPTREALVEATYRNELAKLCDAVPDLLETMAPEQAARAWMDRYVDYMATKRGLADALRAVVASGGNPYAQSRDRLVTAITMLLNAGAEAGTIRSDVEPVDVLAGLSGVTLATGEPSQRAQAARLLNLLMDGLRYRSS